MESYSDSDTSSELDYESNQGSTPGSNYDEDKLAMNLEPKPSKTISEEYSNAP